jgi:hypothetical protein
MGANRVGIDAGKPMMVRFSHRESLDATRFDNLFMEDGPMKYLLIAAVLGLALVLSPSAKAGVFNLDNAPQVATVPADVLAEFIDDSTSDEVPATVAKTPTTTSKPTLTNDQAVRAARAAQQRRQAPANVPSTLQALGQTRGACANGQCGR